MSPPRKARTRCSPPALEPDILIGNNAGPPFRDFRELDRQKMIEGVIGNMIVPVELLQRAIDPMIKKKFGRIVNITSGSVKMPLLGLDLSSGARAGLTAFLGGIARSVAQHNVTINFILPGQFDTDRLRSNHELTAKKLGISLEESVAQRKSVIPAQALWDDEFGATCAFLCGSCRFHHGAEHPARWRFIPGGVLMLPGPRRITTSPTGSTSMFSRRCSAGRRQSSPIMSLGAEQAPSADP